MDNLEEIDRLIYLCTHISQMATNIRSVHLTNLSYSPDNVQTLLSITEDIEGSVILLESLLAMQQRSLKTNEKQPSTRFSYSKEKLLELKNNVTMESSNQIRMLLEQVVEREANVSVDNEKKSWRDIRTILM